MPVGKRDSLLQNYQNVSEANKPPIQWVSGFFPGKSAVGAWYWPITFIYCRDQEWLEPSFNSPLHDFMAWIGTVLFLLSFKRYAYLREFWKSAEQDNMYGPRESSLVDSTLMRVHDTAVCKLPRISCRRWTSPHIALSSSISAARQRKKLWRHRLKYINRTQTPRAVGRCLWLESTLHGIRSKSAGHKGNADYPSWVTRQVITNQSEVQILSQTSFSLRWILKVLR